MRWRRPPVVLLLALVLAGLLGLLATLQWHWLGRISAGEQARMQYTLRRQADALAEDFDREITRAYFWLRMDRVWLQMDQLADRPRGAETGVRPFERWFSGAPHPALVEALYQVTRDDAGAVHVARYEREPATFQSLETWPPELEGLASQLSDDLAAEPWADDHDAGGLPSRSRVGYVEPSIPALVIPHPVIEYRTQAVLTAPEGRVGVDGPGLGDADTSADEASSRGGTVGRVPSEIEQTDVTVAILDTDYIRRELLPSLTARHFRVNGDLDYRIAVRDRESDALIYCSAADPGQCRFDEPDHAEDMFRIRLRDFGRFLVDDRLEPPSTPGDEASAYRLSPVRPPTAERTTTTRRARPEGPWLLVAKHHSGSLEAVVASARARNLFVSFGVLLLLATSLGLVLVSTGRARQLAAQQMEFVAGVSHELRTPLTVIRSAAENLADGVVADRGQIRRYGALIASEGRRLTHMVEQVMEFAGMATGGRHLDRRPVSLRAIVDDALAVCAPQARQEGCTIDVHVPAHLPAVLADLSALSRSVQNLLNNAIKYGGDSGRVRLTADVATPPASEVQLNVTDHGPGIAAEDLPRIFEPFYRGRDAESGRIHGSGLGLSLVARIMEEHHGRVTVRSQAGNGTTFTLHIPAAPPEGEPAAEAVTA